LYEANGLTPYVQEQLNEVLLQFEKPTLNYYDIEKLQRADAAKAKKLKSKKKK
jgi:hypothetical protein